MSANNPDNTDDITLSSLKKSLLDFGLVIYLFFKGIAAFFIRHKITILICTILMAGVGAALAFKVRKVYSLRMIVSHNDLTKKTFAESIDQLNRLASSKSYDQLSNALKLNEANARKIRHLESYNMNNEPLLTDTSTSKEFPFVIAAEVYDNNVSGLLQKSIIDYFNTNEFLTAKKEVQKKNYEDRLAFIINEQKKLDSLKEKYNQFLSSSGKNAMFYNNAFNPVDLYEKSNQYQFQREQIFNWLSNEYKTVKLIDGFKPSVKPVAGLKERIIFYFLLAGLFLGSVIGGLLELDKLSKRKAG